VELAAAKKDNATLNFLQWFVTEQVEEEASVDAVVQKIRLARNAPGAQFMIDRMLAQRAAG
jgi:ferritin